MQQLGHLLLTDVINQYLSIWHPIFADLTTI
jgi:hypothetical protein